MKLNEVIENREQKISELKFLELLKNEAHNSHRLAKRTPLFKTFRGGADYLLLNPTVSNRKSTFFIESIINELHSWSRYPLRTKSVVTYSDRDLANEKGEGHLYVIIPLDKVRLTVTNDTSVTKSFKRAAVSLQLPKLDNEGVINWVKDLFDVANKIELKLEYKEPTSYNELKALLVLLEQINHTHVKKVSELPDTDLSEQRFIDFASRNGNVWAYLNNLLDPENNDFALITPDANFIALNKEVWVGGKAIAIKQSKYQELHDRGDIK